MTVLRRIALLVVALSAFPEGIATASDVSSMLSIGVDVKENIEPAVAYASSHGAYIAVWKSEQNASTHDIWARAVTTDGTLDSVFVVETISGWTLMHPAVAYGSAQDEYLVAYVDMPYSIWVRRIPWNGPGSSSSSSIGGGIHPAVAYNSQDDEFIVVHGTSDGYIKAVTVTAETGAASTPTTLASGSTTKEFSKPDVVYDPENNQYVVVYYFRDSDALSAKVLIRTVAADLSGMSPEYEIADLSSTGSFAGPAISAGPQGVLVTYDFLGATTQSIFARRAQFDGTPLGAANGFLVLSGTSNLYKGDADVCFDGDGRHLVVWASLDLSVSEGNIQGRKVSASSDETIGSRFGIDTSVGDQKEPAVACTGEGLALVVLSDKPNPTPNDYDVVGYLVSAKVFEDDFESGDCTEWSSVVGEVP